MKTLNDKCEPTLISQFFDGELGPEKHDRVKSHIDICPKCSKILEEVKTLSGYVKTHLMGEQDPIPRSTPLENRIINRIRKKDSGPWERFGSRLLSKKSWIPVAAMASMVLIFFTLFRTPGIPEPSAIITSLSGDTDSVIIMETPDTGHTILWFTEVS